MNDSTEPAAWVIYVRKDILTIHMDKRRQIALKRDGSHIAIFHGWRNSDSRTGWSYHHFNIRFFWNEERWIAASIALYRHALDLGWVKSHSENYAYLAL